ncbi:hypothetical protein A2943_00480 [Candidatus Adlerbacteria bacterium RIFCSPLOWO2_01_FULL_51_16]|uniref:Peptidoglycan binding-like domain-containing protein n=1 Tax=Candidatus Adlerbacteria bacterium RIFCSPLOWO2_01_FULL_51_16 TaxID=1797243 RepID=A0A1F4XHY3_9BACT|nr:MAG: hypothetical protein A2943_00480 [Candidatus Adlerbacteria bacterium RIFCSPLOWO2_01_FULL_51_16]
MSIASSLDISRIVFFNALAASVALVCFFALPTPLARAAELDETQIRAILGLLESFDANKTTVEGVESALRGTGEIEAFKNQDADEDIDDDDDKDEAEDHDDDNGDDDDTSEVKKDKSASLRQGPTCPRLAKLLRRGMRNEGPQNPDVSELQQFLADHYGVAKEDLVTGYFGPLTHKYLVQFQGEEGLPTYGIAGELTRGKILRHCVKKFDDNSGNIKERAATTTPYCILKADKKEIEAGEEVTLKWESKNATYASMPDGSKGPTSGSLQVAPTETTVYQKKVYGPGGEGACTAEILVEGDIDGSAPAKEIVTIPLGNMFASAANVLAATAAMPFWIITDALSNVFLQMGLQ